MILIIIAILTVLINKEMKKEAKMKKEGEKKKGKEKKKDLDAILQEALETAPSIEGYTIRQLSDVIKSPWSTTRWHLERLEARGIVEPYWLGRAKIYRLNRERKERRKGNDDIV